MYDKIILGAGLYGLYSALFCAKQNQKILVLEYDDAPFKRATYINQARVHMGYHYPRSYSTAIKSAGYFKRFNEDYGFSILTKFDQIYATSANFSWTGAKEFKKFCHAAKIRCDDVCPDQYFLPGMCDGAFLTEEYTYDAQILKHYYLKELSNYPNVEILYSSRIEKIYRTSTHYRIYIKGHSSPFESDYVLNATYASVNQILHQLEFEPFKIKYELCEIIICDIQGGCLENIGITVMDGPFFSIMPFGKTGFHSLTSVTFTPHLTSYDILPTFECQQISNGFCSPVQLGNCNDCRQAPKTSWDYMSNLAKKYLRKEYSFRYCHSLYSMKPILKMSEIDDSRPTIIKYFSKDPTFVSILSGKINTVYDLDEILKG